MGGKVFIETFHCKTPSMIFTGKDALRHAIFYSKYGRVCENANLLYQLNVKLLVACSWHQGNNAFAAKEIQEGAGVHMKAYELEDYIIYSSQNNVSSPLFEMAILFEKREKLLDFFKRSISRAKEYSNWWKFNKQY